MKLAWTEDAPAFNGYYWYRHPASHEAPTLVRVDIVEGRLKAYFTGIAVHADLRMLAGGCWAGPLPRPQ